MAQGRAQSLPGPCSGAGAASGCSILEGFPDGLGGPDSLHAKAIMEIAAPNKGQEMGHSQSHENENSHLPLPFFTSAHMAMPFSSVRPPKKK
jgi:hypothetical protein